MCASPDCGPYEVNTACGPTQARAVCGDFGYAYELPCDPDCESLAEAACKGTVGCAWAVSCANEPYLEEIAPLCIDYPKGTRTCADLACPMGTRCAEIGLRPSNLSSGDCAGEGAVYAVCVPSP